MKDPLCIISDDIYMLLCDSEDSGGELRGESVWHP